MIWLYDSLVCDCQSACRSAAAGIESLLRLDDWTKHTQPTDDISAQPSALVSILESQRSLLADWSDQISQLRLAARAIDPAGSAVVTMLELAMNDCESLKAEVSLSLSFSLCASSAS
jgi:hypothetical protein